MAIAELVLIWVIVATCAINAYYIRSIMQWFAHIVKELRNGRR